VGDLKLLIAGKPDDFPLLLVDTFGGSIWPCECGRVDELVEDHLGVMYLTSEAGDELNEACVSGAARRHKAIVIEY
jgi:hypothetical protein